MTEMYTLSKDQLSLLVNLMFDALKGSPLAENTTYHIGKSQDGTKIRLFDDKDNVVSEIEDANTVYENVTTAADGLMSKEDKAKLNSIASGATNVTDNSQIGNGAGYQTADNVRIYVESKGYKNAQDVDEIVTAKGYQTENDVRNIVNIAIGGRLNVRFAIVQELPAVGEEGIFYLIRHEKTETDVFDEYIWIIDGNSGRFEKIGDTAVDLTDYALKSEVQSVSTEVTGVKNSVGNIPANTTVRAEIDNLYGHVNTLYGEVRGTLTAKVNQLEGVQSQTNAQLRNLDSDYQTTRNTVAQHNGEISGINNHLSSVDSVLNSTLSMADDTKNRTTVNMLNPTLVSNTVRGVTVQSNNDGTYTVSGANSSEEVAQFYFANIADMSFVEGESYKVIGIPRGANGIALHIGSAVIDTGSGATGTFPFSGTKIFLRVQPGADFSTPITVKPMITTNLKASYVDFVPYTGDTGKLCGDVADIKKEVKALSDAIDGGGSSGGGGSVSVDTELSASSTNPVQNKAIYEAVNGIRRVTRSEVDANGHLIVSYSDGTSDDAGKVISDFIMSEPTQADYAKALFGDGHWRNVYSESDGSTFYVVTDDPTFYGGSVTLANDLGDSWSSTIDNSGNAIFQDIKLGGTFTATAKSSDNVYTARSNSDTNMYYGAHVLRLVPQFNKIRVQASYGDAVGQTVTIKNAQNTAIASAVMPQSKEVEVIVDTSGTVNIEATINGIHVHTATTFTEYGETNTVSLPLPAYGYCIDEDNSDPDTMVTYTDAAVGMTPAHMDFTNDVFDYGSWENAFFMPKPCMLKFDGTVDYYLDPDDYTKKEDGTASDVADITYQGNAMMEWPIIYTKHWEDGSKKYCQIAPTKLDNDFHAYANIGSDGSLGHFYTAIYDSVLDNNNRIRSISGQSLNNEVRNTTFSSQIQKATNNGVNWYSSVIVDRFLINDLIILMIKSTYSQSKIGYGYTGASDEYLRNTMSTGMLNDKGLFYGRTNTDTSFVKVFGIENYYGARSNWQAGYIININAHPCFKLTRNTLDGSTVNDYNTTGDGYIEMSNITARTYNRNYITQCKMTPYGLIPYMEGGSSSTKYTDGGWSTNTNVPSCAMAGGGAGQDTICGIFAFSLNQKESFVENVVTGLSYKP